MSKGKNNATVKSVCDNIVEYLSRVQEFAPGEYYGSFWSEKAYHGPLLDYHAGGSHHNRTAGSAGLGLWLIGCERQDRDLKERAEAAFDWVTARQRPGGGYYEIQNNERPSDWEMTGLEECSTIELYNVVYGLGHALLSGLKPKKMYRDCLMKAGHWLLSIERPVGSGVFPHHDRSPYDCLNANMFAAQSLAIIHTTMSRVYGQTVNIFAQGALRAARHTLELQWADGSFPYSANQGSTINYTSCVVWSYLDIMDLLPEDSFERMTVDKIKTALRKAAGFLRDCVNRDGTLKWDHETSSAKHNITPYVFTCNLLWRQGGEVNRKAALRLLGYLLSQTTKEGLLPMRDEGEVITECAPMQADMLLFLLPLAGTKI